MPRDPNAFEGKAVVFDGPEDYHHRIDDPALEIDEHTVLFMRGAGPIGYPGAAEVVNMRAPDYLLKKGITSLPCIGDGRQSVRRVRRRSSMPRRKRRQAGASPFSRPATACASILAAGRRIS